MAEALRNKRLLFVAPPYFGHVNQMLVLAGELASRGLCVAFAGADLFRDRITRAGVSFLRWEPEDAMPDRNVITRRAQLWSNASRYSSRLRGEREMLAVFADSYDAMYLTLEPLWRQFNLDLAVVDSAALPALDLARQHGVPSIIQLQFLGNVVPISPRYPRFGTDYSIRMSPWQRALNCLHPLWVLANFATAIVRINRARARHRAVTPLKDFYNTSLTLVCSAFGIELPRALPPLMKMVGPILPRGHAPLEASLEAWLSGGNESPTVYVCFGTLAALERQQVLALVEGLSDPRWRVLWSLRPAQQSLLPSLPKTFNIQPHVPQQAVLAHPSVRAFVSHCGMNSVSESLYYGKPLLAVPFFGDQHYNAARVADIGAGLRLHKLRLSSEAIRSHAAALLEAPGYARAAQSMKAVLRRMGGLDEAVEVVEDALAHGFGHLIPEVLYAPKPGAPPSIFPGSARGL
ncbi:MAG TPA: glycosyltransferase [Dongiaceae bacterium]|nr:glycosyltransferase [Dongiaceae bacterium]